ncbi:hypothetical protein LTR84_001312 [Exophiala bonariae]|uniref:Uncharacterized protein n=1 Tax=Exophiala bonariae TaxID=1690606 RepID=A0AAV9NC17_9EURO|nr:hypothetical protein LTR84_001312 [Exophiala bonariae]
MAVAALRYTSASTTILRSRLENNQNTLSSTDYWHIITLWGSEIICRNFDAAIIHGGKLAQLMVYQAEQKCLDLTYLRYVIYNDVQLCTMLMERSFFDYARWVPEQFELLRASAENLMESEGDGATSLLDLSIEGDFLINTFRERRAHHKEFLWWQDRSFEGMNPFLHGWLGICQHICHGNLIRHALDCMDEVPVSSGESVGFLLAQAYLSLAALYVSRSVGGQLIIGNTDIYDCRRIILDKLYTALYLAVSHESKADYVKYGNARLWAAYVGAQATHTMPDMAKHYQFFAYEFARARQSCRISTWNHLSRVLDGFLNTFLLWLGFDVNVRRRAAWSWTAIQAATENGFITIFELLLTYGTDINEQSAVERGGTALQTGAEQGHIDTVELLLNRGVNVNASPAKQ